MDASHSPARRPRGRPSRTGQPYADTHALLLQRGVELLTESGASATSVDTVMRSVGVSKGSFYHFFPSKDAFLQAAVQAYAQYFLRKLDRHLGNTGRTPLQRLEDFVDDACAGMERHAFTRGCLVGNLGQEVGSLAPHLVLLLEATLREWEQALAACLDEAIASDAIPPHTDTAVLAHAFWIGWEGAVLRARLVRSTAPMRVFFRLFLAALR